MTEPYLRRTASLRLNVYAFGNPVIVERQRMVALLNDEEAEAYRVMEGYEDYEKVGEA